MRPAAFVDFRCINLDPAPDTTGVHLDAAFGHQLRHVFISQGVLEVPTDALHDHLTGKMAAFEGIGGRDRHAPPRYQTPPPNLATEPILTSLWGLLWVHYLKTVRNPDDSRASFRRWLPS